MVFFYSKFDFNMIFGKVTQPIDVIHGANNLLIIQSPYPLSCSFYNYYDCQTNVTNKNYYISRIKNQYIRHDGCYELLSFFDMQCKGID